MINLIKNMPFKVSVCCILILSLGACTTVTRLSEKEYSEIDQEKTGSYYITLKDGSKHAAKRISITDTTLTIYESKHIVYEGYTDIDKDKLPLTIRLSEIESVRKNAVTSSSFILGTLGVVLILGTFILMKAMESFGEGLSST